MSTDIELYMAMAANRKQQSRREGIEKIQRKCQDDVDNVFHGIENIRLPDDSAESCSCTGPGKSPLLSYLGIREI